MVADNYIYFDGGEVTIFDSQGNISSLAPGECLLLTPVISELIVIVNDTLAIPLAEDWTNVTLNLVHTQRSTEAPIALNFQSLWWDAKQNTIYSFGGERSKLSQRNNTPTPDASIWGFSLNGTGGGSWVEYVGSTANTTWPQGLVRPTNGFWSSDDDTGYFFGGIGNDHTDTSFSGSEFQLVPGLVTFLFASHTMSNSTNVADNASQLAYAGRMIHVPAFGAKGVLVPLGGGPGLTEAGSGFFNNITIFDIDSQTWLSQTAKGDIPVPRSTFCAFGVQGGDNSTFEM